MFSKGHHRPSSLLITLALVAGLLGFCLLKRGGCDCDTEYGTGDSRRTWRDRNTDKPTSHDGHEGDANSGENAAGSRSQGGDERDLHLGGGEARGGHGNGSTRGNGGDPGIDSVDDDYVVLGEAEIGSVIHKICSSPDFQDCCLEVKASWDTLKPNRIEEVCLLMYRKFVLLDPLAASLFEGGGGGEAGGGGRMSCLGWEQKQQHHVFSVMMSTIISHCENPSLLEETLRPLGESHFTRGVKESYYRSLEESLVQALEEVLRPENFPPAVKSSWKAFIGTISTCMMIAGDGVMPCRGRVGIHLREHVAGGEQETAVGRGIGCQPLPLCKIPAEVASSFPQTMA